MLNDLGCGPTSVEHKRFSQEVSLDTVHGSFKASLDNDLLDHELHDSQNQINPRDGLDESRGPAAGDGLQTGRLDCGLASVTEELHNLTKNAGVPVEQVVQIIGSVLEQGGLCRLSTPYPGPSHADTLQPHASGLRHHHPDGPPAVGSLGGVVSPDKGSRVVEAAETVPCSQGSQLDGDQPSSSPIRGDPVSLKEGNVGEVDRSGVKTMRNYPLVDLPVSLYPEPSGPEQRSGVACDKPAYVCPLPQPLDTVADRVPALFETQAIGGAAWTQAIPSVLRGGWIQATQAVETKPPEADPTHSKSNPSGLATGEENVEEGDRRPLMQILEEEEEEEEDDEQGTKVAVNERKTLLKRSHGDLGPADPRETSPDITVMSEEGLDGEPEVEQQRHPENASLDNSVVDPEGLPPAGACGDDRPPSSSSPPVHRQPPGSPPPTNTCSAAPSCPPPGNQSGSLEPPSSFQPGSRPASSPSSQVRAAANPADRSASVQDTDHPGGSLEPPNAITCTHSGALQVPPLGEDTATGSMEIKPPSEPARLLPPGEVKPPSFPLGSHHPSVAQGVETQVR